MKKLTFFFTAVLSILLIASCEKDQAVDNTTAIPNGAMLSAFKTGKESAATQTFTVDAEDGGTVVGVQGTRVTIAPSSLFASVNNMGQGVGNPLTGNVQITLIEVYERKDMVFMNKPTMGKINLHPTVDTLATLVSGGEYYLKITKNNTVVYAPSGVAVHLPVDNTGGPDTDMMQFDGTIDAAGNMTWKPILTSSVTIVEVPVDTAGTQFVTCYQILDNKWGWTSAARFYDFMVDATSLKVKLPTGFNATNTEVYIAYDGEPNTLAALDVFTTDSFFSEKFGLMPVGIDIHFIIVAYLDGQLHYAIKGSTITEGHVENITQSQFHPTTQSELTTLINALQ